MTYFFRVVPDGKAWVSKRGVEILGRASSVDEALGLAEAAAAACRPSEVLLHQSNGIVEVVAAFDDTL
jgi:hypothetical protein